MPTISPLLSESQTTGSPVTITISDGTIDTALGSIFTEAFQQSVQVAMVIVATAVIDLEDSTVPSGTSRKNYARLVIGNPRILAANAIWAVASDGVTGCASTDQDLVDRILSIWDQLCYGS